MDNRDKIPILIPESEIIIGECKQVFIRRGHRLNLVEGVDTNDLRAVFKHIDGYKTVDEISNVLSTKYAANTVREFIDTFEGSALCYLKGEETGRDNTRNCYSDIPTVVIGNGGLGWSIYKRFSEAGWSECVFYHANSFASCLEREFNDLCSKHVVSQSLRSQEVMEGPNCTPHEGITVRDLASCFNRNRFIICALEGHYFRALFDVNRACMESEVPCLFVTVDAEHVSIGPTYVPHATACFVCGHLSYLGLDDKRMERNRLSLFKVSSFPTGLLDRDLIMERIYLNALNEVEWVLGRRLTVRPQFLRSMMSIPLKSAKGRIVRESLDAREDCTECGNNDGIGKTENRLSRLRQRVDCFLPRTRTTSKTIVQCMDSKSGYKSVGIIGAGTAGLLTALALRKKIPHLKTTVIESSQIPVIGVGEATTPGVRQFLHKYLEIDVQEFYLKVRPTWKLGIKFDWGLPGDYYFNYPFLAGQTRLLEAYQYANDINQSSPEAIMMTQNRTFVTKGSSSDYLVNAKAVSYAYHLDNKRFVSYLKQRAISEGVRFKDRTISEVVTSPGNDLVDHVRTSLGEELKFDLYVDCSGFRSLLLEKGLGSGFVDFSDSLFTDSAVVAKVPNNGPIRPYTLAETMDHGWCWNIPQMEADHRGYVFSSHFCNVDDAVSEMRAKNPGMTDHWIVKFRSGRHEHFWKGNVVAIGNAYGFVEPLESTALDMITDEIEALIEYFPSSRNDHQVSHIINSRLARRWDYLRWFLAIHYKFNRKLTTPFWRECRESVDISGAMPLVEHYLERCPLTYRHDQKLLEAEFERTGDVFGLSGIDYILLGQKVLPRSFTTPFETQSIWSRRMSMIKKNLRLALPQREALEVLERFSLYDQLRR